MAKDTKTFVNMEDNDNPAVALIKHGADKPEGTPKADTQDERKTKRIQLILTPSSVENARKVCYMKRLSLNEFVQQALNQAIKDNPDLIEQYDNIYSK